MFLKDEQNDKSKNECKIKLTKMTGSERLQDSKLTWKSTKKRTRILTQTSVTRGSEQ